MKNFIPSNWYRLITATAMLIFACAVFTSALKNNVAKAGAPNNQASTPAPADTWIVVKGNTVYEATWNRSLHNYQCRAVCED